MPTIQLKTHSGDHLGYLLISGTEPLDSDVTERDCLLTGPPKDQAPPHPISDAMQQHQQIEHRLQVTASGSGLELSADIAGSGRLVISLPDKHAGTWTFSGAAGETRGPCSLP